MKSLYCTILLISISFCAEAQLSPAITSWLQNTTETGTYYVAGNATALENNILVNCQKIEYSDDFVYVHTTGVPSYPTGPFQDGNPSQAADQEAIYKMPLHPQPSNGANANTTPGNIGIFVNGVSLYDYRDGVAWNPQTNALCGGPGGAPCPGGMMAVNDWNRDAIPAERLGFDCSKAHPGMGNYHHHQNPSAFKLDIEVVSDVCNLYDADGLYAIDSTAHAPLIGYAYDGYPIYGAYGYANADGTGGITRIKSGYKARNITQRSQHADGSTVDNGPDISTTYPIGYFREDYEWVAYTTDEYLDVHNGRQCVTPEYPEGTYAYFATVDENWNSTYPYVVGPTFYGVSERRNVDSVNESTTVYDGALGTADKELSASSVTVFPNPSADLIAVQVNRLVQSEITATLYSLAGQLIERKTIMPGSTIAYFDIQTLYNGVYLVTINSGSSAISQKVVVSR